MTEEQTTYTPADPQWHERRRDRLGASELAAMLGISPYMSAWELQQLKLGRLEPWSGNDATQAGKDYERALLDIAERELGQAGNDYERALMDVAERELGPLLRQVWVLHPTLPLAATCDGLTIADRIDGVPIPDRPVEAKTTGLVGPVYGHWGDAGSDEIPESYLVQVHAQLMCTQADMAYLYALIAGRGTVRFEIERSDSVAEMLGNQISDWWERHIVQGIEVEQTEPPKLEVVKRLRKVPNKVIELTGEIDVVLFEMELAKKHRKRLNDTIQACEAAILMALGDAEAGTLPDGRRVEYMEVKRRGYTCEPTTYRQLRIK